MKMSHPHRRALLLLVTACLLAPLPTARAQGTGDKYEKPGLHKVDSLTLDWTDPARDNRAVPVKIYYPETAAATPLPVIVFSHGLGGSREGYAYLGQHWASHGYIAVHVQHVGSDESVWKDKPPRDRMQALREVTLSPQNAINRPRDVSFALDQLTKMNTQEGALRGRVDMTRVGMSGHSFGAHTTLAIAGQTLGRPGKLFSGNLGDPRVKAAIAMSPQAPATPMSDQQLDQVYSTIRIPMMHMTGTLDTSPINAELKPEQRQIPYQHSHQAPASLLVFNGGDHMVFSGRSRNAVSLLHNQGSGEKDAEMHKLILVASTAFWDAHLKSDEAAATFLRDGNFQKELGDLGTWQTKLPKP